MSFPSYFCPALVIPESPTPVIPESPTPVIPESLLSGIQMAGIPHRLQENTSTSPVPAGQPGIFLCKAPKKGTKEMA